MRIGLLYFKKSDSQALKKRPFLLFEILIALSLTAILLTFLFSFFVESVKIEKKIDAMRSEITARQHLQTRLQAVMTGIHRESGTSPFYTQTVKDEGKESLIAIFDNGIDPDPAFSGSVMGRIYLDEQSNLSLATWPLDPEEKHRPWRKEILLSHVKEFEFEFMAQKREEEKIKKEQVKPINSTLEWRAHWSKSRSEIPPIIRLSVWKENQKDPLRFAFLIPSVEPLATYWEGGKKP